MAQSSSYETTSHPAVAMTYTKGTKVHKVEKGHNFGENTYTGSKEKKSNYLPSSYTLPLYAEDDAGSTF